MYYSQRHTDTDTQTHAYTQPKASQNNMLSTVKSYIITEKTRISNPEAETIDRKLELNVSIINFHTIGPSSKAF